MVLGSQARCRREGKVRSSLRWVAIGFAAAVFVLIPANATAHSDCHYTGQYSTGTWRGGGACIEVGNPDLVPSSSNGAFVAQRILVKQQNQQAWIEVGWAEVASRQGSPEIYTYAYPNTSGWAFHGSLGQGAYICVRVQSACGVVCNWTASILSGGSWVPLRSHAFGSSPAQYLEAYSEVNTGSPCHSHPHLATSPNTTISWSSLQVRNSSNQWVGWTTGAGWFSSAPPYAAAFTSPFYQQFDTYRSGGSTC